MDITELLAFSAKQNASDLHLSAGLPPMIRVDGDIRRLNVPAMEDREVRKLIYDIMGDRQRRDYEEFLKRTFPSKCRAWRASVSTPSTRHAVPVRSSVPFPAKC